jgi:two-component system cell cycle sensor histidine kinase/response regulator CckA
MLERTIGEHINMLARPAPQPMTVHADPSQLQQVLLNLAINARDAMPEGGTLVLEVNSATLGGDEVNMQPPLPAGTYARLLVSDTGEGMSPETAARVFEPFFTTKPQGKGTGLGLATVYGIVTEAGGSINVYSEPGIGTTFRVYFPAADTPAPASDPVADAPPIARGEGETVLVVEDQPAMLKLTCRILQANGYRTLAASGPEVALRVAAENEFDLVVTDLLMPDMSGRDLAERIEALRPGRPTLFMSGYGEELLGAQRMIPEGSAFLPKPFTEQTLLEKVRAVCTARRAI